MIRKRRPLSSARNLDARAFVLPGRSGGSLGGYCLRPDQAPVEGRPERHGGQIFYRHRRADGRQCRRDFERDPPRQGGQTLTGTTQSIGDKSPVTVKLLRKQTGDTFDFRGQISIGQTVTEVASSENSDVSEKEFQDSQTVDDGITAAPKDFTEVSPESVGVRVKLDAAVDFLKSLKGQDVEVALNSLTVTCDALRAGQQTISLSVDPDRAAARSG